MEVSRFAAKYNVILPEYAIDSDQLIEKITAWMDIEGSGLISVTWGAATSILSILALIRFWRLPLPFICLRKR